MASGKELMVAPLEIQKEGSGFLHNSVNKSVNNSILGAKNNDQKLTLHYDPSGTFAVLDHAVILKMH